MPKKKKKKKRRRLNATKTMKGELFDNKEMKGNI